MIEKKDFNAIAATLAKGIEKSKGDITILFTDIEESTHFWEVHGDTMGRLMLDLHNKLMFPVIKTHRGTVLKTIGDSIMAAFKSPAKALDAAIAMQQLLRKFRKEKHDLHLKIRIGIHTGKAIIERGDVFGDVVNVASRIESAAQGGEDPDLE